MDSAIQLTFEQPGPGIIAHAWSISISSYENEAVSNEFRLSFPLVTQQWTKGYTLYSTSNEEYGDDVSFANVAYV